MRLKGNAHSIVHPKRSIHDYKYAWDRGPPLLLNPEMELSEPVLGTSSWCFCQTLTRCNWISEAILPFVRIRPVYRKLLKKLLLSPGIFDLSTSDATVTEDVHLVFSQRFVASMRTCCGCYFANTSRMGRIKRRKPY